MREMSPEGVQGGKDRESQFNPDNLKFKELQAAYKLAHATFKETEDGFESIDGDIIVIREIGGVYKIESFPDAKRRENFHAQALFGPNTEIIRGGTSNKEELMKALRQMIQETGNRIIE